MLFFSIYGMLKIVIATERVAIILEILEGIPKMILLVLWQIMTAVQGLLSYGTAYRLTKSGGDNGAALFGWFLVLGLASAIPGLGLYLWFRYRDG